VLFSPIDLSWIRSKFSAPRFIIFLFNSGFRMSTILEHLA
jgi:hypothetical protein